MQTYRHLLAGVDGSPAAWHAFGEALNLPDCLITATAVLPPLPGAFKEAGPEVEARRLAPLAAALERCREEAAGRGITLDTVMAAGEPHEVLSAAAREHGCDLVVVGKRGWDLPPGEHMGRVTQRVIGFCPLDVLVVPVRGRLDLSRILLPVDGSRFSRRAASRALSLAGERGGEVWTVAVLDAPPNFAREVPEVAHDLLHQLEKLVAGIAREAAARNIPCRTRVASGPAYRVIVDLAREWQAGLVVMGSRGRTGLKRLLMGSVTERVVGRAPCPVLVVKGAEGAGKKAAAHS